jgi:hypothetical protein
MGGTIQTCRVHTVKLETSAALIGETIAQYPSWVHAVTVTTSATEHTMKIVAQIIGRSAWVLALNQQKVCIFHVLMICSS